jgi:polyisoprenoid-binding protein YceI
MTRPFAYASAVLLSLALGVAGCSKPAKAPGADQAKAPAAATPADAPAGDYVDDPAHTSLTFRLSHMGFSRFTARFEKVDVKLKFDPKDPTKTTVEASIDPKSIAHDNPPKGFLDELAGKEFLDAAAFPAITFKSTKVVQTGANTADVTGDLSLHGVTKPVTLQVTYNGGYPGMSMDPHARVGFSAHGALSRAAWRVSGGEPAPGSSFGVGDEVEFDIETELTGPPLAK